MTTFSDRFYVSITARVRIIFTLFGLISLSASLFVWFSNSPATDWDLFYIIGFPISTATCFYAACRPRIGDGSVFLLPLFVVSAVRLVDIWMNYFSGDINLSTATLGGIGWSFLLVFISYVDLLESRIYHRLVTRLEQAAE